MLAADKLQLQSALKQQATALKEKEFQLHHSNLMTVGTQAAVLAGLDITMFIEFAPAPLEAWTDDLRLLCMILKTIYYSTIIAAFCANMIVVSHTTALSVWGAGLALRGPDGSMMTATDGLYEERRNVFWTFGCGLFLTVASVLVGVWLLLPASAAGIGFVVALWTIRQIWCNYRRVTARFYFDESETVDFRDIMEGPAVRGLKNSLRSLMNGNKSPRSAKKGGGRNWDDDGDNDEEMQSLNSHNYSRQNSGDDTRTRRRQRNDDSPSVRAGKIQMV